MLFYRVRPKLVTHPAKLEISVTHANLFAGSKQLMKSIPDEDKGPRLDSKGIIVKHTLVGSVAGFNQEKQRRFKVKPQVKLSVVAQDIDALSHRSSRNSFTRTIQSGIIDQQTDGTKSSNKKHRNKTYKEIIMNQQDVLQDIDQVQNRLKSNQLKLNVANQAIIEKLNIGDQLQTNNFERAIDNFHGTMKSWNTQKSKANSVIPRNPGESMDERIEQYRVKEEYKQLLDSLMPPEVKYGNEYWKLGLRQDINPCQYSSEHSKVQQIRRCSSTGSLRPFTSFSSSKYLQQKLDDNAELVSKLLPCSNPNELVDMVIKGKNVLSNEIAALQINNMSAKSYVKKVPLKPEVTPDELIASQFDRNAIIKSGKYGSMKLSQ